jgi:drug/metabolite transporter (DMT)-like permease
MGDLGILLVVVAALSFATYAAHKGWQNGQRMEVLAFLIACWGGGGMLLIIMGYRLIVSLLNISITPPALLLPLAVGLGIAGVIGWLWLAALHTHEWLKGGR